jgi:hypothetical protein
MFFEGMNLVNMGNIQAGLNIIFPALVFLVIAIFSNVLLLSGFKQFADNIWLAIGGDTQEDLGTAFVLGFLSWSLILTGKSFSVLKGFLSVIPRMGVPSVLSSAQSSLSVAQNYLINGIMAPFLEEVFFLFILGGMIWYFMGTLGIKSVLFKSVVSLILVSFFFAQFHTFADPFTQFWMIAFTFSVVIRGLSILDLNFDIIPSIAILLTFTIGVHMANNMIELAGGIIPFFQGLAGNTLYFVLVFGVFALNFYWFGKRIYSVVS